MNVEILSFLGDFSQIFTLLFVLPGMLLLGLYLTYRLGFVQFFKLKMSFGHLLKKNKECKGNMSHFEAISAVLAGNFGTGNISGMAVAITMGGPGALVWMWVMAFLGAAIQFASCLLAVKYRTTNEKGEYVGGPMYYLSKGLGLPRLGSLFAVLTLFGAITVGNLAQVNSMSLPLEQLGISPLMCGIGMAICVSFVILGGLQRMAKWASLIVPLKAFLYLGTGLIIIALNFEMLGPAIKMMFKAAIDPYAVTGGLVGAGILKAITTGFDRGIFATDAGTGIVPILQSGARTSNAVIDGVVTLVAPFMVMVVCTTTGLILLMTGAWQQPELQSTNMVTYAFTKGLGSPIGGYIVIVALALFGYTTILAWACCAEKALGYLFGVKYATRFKYLYIALLPLGALIRVDLVWVMADICVTSMLVTNMIGIAGLSREVIKDTHQFFKKGEDEIESVISHQECHGQVDKILT